MKLRSSLLIHLFFSVFLSFFALSPSPAKADFASQQIETTCAPKINFFVFRAYTQADVAEDHEVLSGPAGQTTIESMNDWVHTPVKCTLKFPQYPAHTIEVSGTNFAPNSSGSCSNGGASPKLIITLDGKKIYTERGVFSFCAFVQTTIEFTPQTLSFCAMPDINYSPVGRGDQQYSISGFEDLDSSKTPGVDLICHVLDI